MKEKRAVIKSALARMRRDHALSAAEVGDHDTLNLARFGFCSVGTDSRKLEAVVEKARTALETLYPLEVIEEDVSFDTY